jgi:putative ABC transport system substrate-binding protein
MGVSGAPNIDQMNTTYDTSVRVTKRDTSKVALKFGGLCFLVIILLVSGTPALQERMKHHHVALVVFGRPGSTPAQIRGLNDGLEELGYVTGKNLTIELLQREDYDELRSSLRSLSQKAINAIITTSGAETAVVKDITRAIPIIFMPAGDPVRSGFVNSLASPRTNLTGLSFFGDSEDSGKQLQVFKKVVPSLRSVLVLYDRRKEESVPTASTLEAIKRVAAHLIIQLIESPVSSVAEAEHALRRARTTVNGIFIICSPIFRTFKKIASIALEKRLPVFGCNASQVAEERALVTYAPDMYYIGYRAAWYVDRILRGAKPHDLPVETPMKFELVINLNTAKEIGLTIPPEVLILADKVINY